MPSMPTSTKSSAPGPMLSIGAVSRATGIPVETLRTWERRYGLLRAERRPTGHRHYPVSAVAHLRRITAALAHGHRPADVMTLTERDLDSLLDALHSPRLAPPLHETRATRVRATGPARVRDALAAISDFDGAGLRLGLEAAAARGGPREFIEDFAVPLMKSVGRAWTAGRLAVRHEHFATAHVADVLRELRRRAEKPGRGPRVAVASLPGDRHELGTLMASVILAEAGWTVIYLGQDTPAEQLTALAHDAALEAVAIGVSSTAPRTVREELRSLVRDLPSSTRLVVGGAGVPTRVTGSIRVANLAALERWAVAEQVRLQSVESIRRMPQRSRRSAARA